MAWKGVLQTYSTQGWIRISEVSHIMPSFGFIEQKVGMFLVQRYKTKIRTRKNKVRPDSLPKSEKPPVCNC